jgi:hypothetical protein
MAERRNALPPDAGSSMAPPELNYRIRQRGTEWHWQVITYTVNVLASGMEDSSRAARKEALTYCMKHQPDESKDH